MGTRPLRQYYDGVMISFGDDRALVDGWTRHRRRLVAALEALTDEQWRTTTRCTNWDARGVVSHLVTVDGFWTGSMRGVLTRAEPTSFIRGFDPSTGTDAFVEPLLALPTDAILETFVDGNEAFVATVETFADDDWDGVGESPVGHVSARMLLAHAYWDSWLHERDILRPLGLAPPVERDDLLAATSYTLVFGALQGGLLDDDAPVGPGPDAPIDVTLRFADLPDDALRVTIDRGVGVVRSSGTDTVPGGSALQLVESVTGRESSDALRVLPADLAAELDRAACSL